MAVNDHGFYYGKAHKLFNRATKRVCFTFDPFEKKEHVKDEDYDEYQPFSRFLPSCRSTVICEDYSHQTEASKCQQLSSGYQSKLKTNKQMLSHIIYIYTGVGSGLGGNGMCVPPPPPHFLPHIFIFHLNYMFI